MQSFISSCRLDFSLYEDFILFRLFRSPQWALFSSSIAPIGTWQLNSRMVQKNLAREKRAQWDPLERKESRILNDAILFFSLPYCVPYSLARRFYLTRLFICKGPVARIVSHSLEAFPYDGLDRLNTFWDDSCNRHDEEHYMETSLNGT